MALTVGIDTYVTVSEADDLVNRRFISSDAQRVAWSQLSADDKEIVLRNAAGAVDSVAYTGIKRSSNQALAFPRCFKSRFADHVAWYETKNIIDGIWHCQSDAPQEVKDAQVFEAVELASPGPDTERFNTYNGVVTSSSVVGLSESYVVAAPSSIAGLANALRSRRAHQLLGRYVGRYRVK